MRRTTILIWVAERRDISQGPSDRPGLPPTVRCVVVARATKFKLCAVAPHNCRRRNSEYRRRTMRAMTRPSRPSKRLPEGCDGHPREKQYIYY